MLTGKKGIKEMFLNILLSGPVDYLKSHARTKSFCSSDENLKVVMISIP